MVEPMIELPMRFSKEQIANFCQRWQIREFALFGSILRDDFCDDSDIDVLVTFDLDAHWGLLAHVRMERELGEILGRKVDLIERGSIEESPNWIRRKEILNTARTFYVKG
ncbi:MAG: nucleotidyltransferase domain-containing protein [Microcoleus vaginatus WJT46-NPBG5]|nr:nucleotidyltransferase domain-containing protein [Microcoleus vaginatus WJT46-NPBG5]